MRVAGKTEINHILFWPRYAWYVIVQKFCLREVKASYTKVLYRGVPGVPGAGASRFFSWHQGLDRTQERTTQNERRHQDDADDADSGILRGILRCLGGIRTVGMSSSPSTTSGRRRATGSPQRDLRQCGELLSAVWHSHVLRVQQGRCRGLGVPPIEARRAATAGAHRWQGTLRRSR